MTYYYPETGDPALDRVSLNIEPGEFVFLTGPSGCGKSTLLRALAGLLPDYYGGKIGGSISFRQTPLERWDKKQLAKEVGMIFQDPETQVVMTSVEQEIAFGLENVNTPPQEMRRRIAEMLALFGLSGMREESTFNLSGGQKQKVVLAAVLAMHPKVLLLDEPTSQLDPVAAQELLNYVQRLNLEWGLTVVLVEQRVDRCFHLADKVVFMENGRIVKRGGPREVVKWAAPDYLPYLPPVAQLFARWGTGNIPLTVKEGREVLAKVQQEITIDELSSSRGQAQPAELLQAINLYAAYNKRDLVLKKVNFSLFAGTITIVLGENGAGKSTLLKTICGLVKPVKGKVWYRGKDITALKPEQIAGDIGYLSQNPNDYLFNDTVAEEIEFNLKIKGRSNEQEVTKLLQLLGLAGKQNVNPRDLSGGERQRVALGTVLISRPSLLLLDEPTRGLDGQLKHRLGEILQTLKNRGMGILMVTHDVEFAAELGDRIVIMSNGEIVADGDKKEILANSLYYAPQINRLFKGFNDRVMTVGEGLQLLPRACSGLTDHSFQEEE